MTIYAVDYSKGIDQRTYYFVPLNATPVLTGRIGTTEVYMQMKSGLIKLPHSVGTVLLTDQEYNGQTQIRQLTQEQEKDLLTRIQNAETTANR